MKKTNKFWRKYNEVLDSMEEKPKGKIVIISNPVTGKKYRVLVRGKFGEFLKMSTKPKVEEPK